jgi:hypothetical protein
MASDQLQLIMLVATIDGCTILGSISGSGGRSDRGPMYAQTMPLRSRVGYAFARTLVLKLLSAGSEGMSTQAPITSNFQP